VDRLWGEVDKGIRFGNDWPKGRSSRRPSVFGAGVRVPLGTTFLLNEVRVPQVRGARNDFPEGEGVREGRRSSRNDCRRVRLPERCDGQCPELEKPLGFEQEHEKTRSVFGAGVRAPKVRVAGQEFEKTEGLRGTNVVSVSTEGTKKRRSSTGRCEGGRDRPLLQEGVDRFPPGVGEGNLVVRTYRMPLNTWRTPQRSPVRKIFDFSWPARVTPGSPDMRLRWGRWFWTNSRRSSSISRNAMI